MTRHLGWIAMALLVSLAAHAQKSSVVPEVAAKLHAAEPSAPWSGGWSEKADVTCHGQKDILVVAHDAHKVWLGVVRTAQFTSHAQTLVSEWPIDRTGQSSFCAAPVKIEFYPRSCKNEDGPLASCKPIAGCMAFTLVDSACDGFNFYWDHDKHGFRWWRRQHKRTLTNYVRNTQENQITRLASRYASPKPSLQPTE